MSVASPKSAGFDHVTDWVFDLDNTLYPSSCDLFAQIHRLITDYTQAVTGLDRAAALALQLDYYRHHGTTLNGLMRFHGVDPEHYLSKVHAIDYSCVMPHPELVAAIEALPGRKFVFTNADSGHAEAVLDRLGGAGLFEGIFDIRAAGYLPKPMRKSYEDFVERFGVNANSAAMFDDLAHNLEVPHAMGMRTVQILLAPGDRADPGHAHVHHATGDLAAFLLPYAA